MEERSGRYTFVYTDLSGSSALWAADEKAARAAIAFITEATNTASDACGGQVFKSLGDGHAVVFSSNDDALKFVVTLQDSLAGQPFEVRAAVHAGDVTPVTGDYQGTALIEVARMTELGSGSQVLVSAAALAPGYSFVPRGQHRLRGVTEPIELHELVLPGKSACSKPLRGAKSVLPSPVRQVVGRSAEAKLVSQWLRRGHRLVTITGFGGIGKTTLAQVVASNAAHSFRDGAVWVPCEGITSDDELDRAITQSLVSAWSQLDPSATWEEVLPRRHVLLVLDCCETLAAERVIPDRFLAECPELTILATSRAVFGSDYEHEFALKGLADVSKSRPNLAAAVSLFESAAQQADPHFRVKRSNVSLVRQIVRQVEAIPLAIVLVAGRLRHRTLDELAEMVQTRVLEAAASSARSGRHASLSAVVSASFELLDPDERESIGALSVFAGQFSRQDSGEVCGDDYTDKLDRLRDNSLLNVDKQGRWTYYRLLDPVREYSRDTVDDDRWQVLLQSHCRRMVERASEVAREFKAGPSRRAAAEMFRLEADFRQAVRTSLRFSLHDELRSFAAHLCLIYTELGLGHELETLAGECLKVCRSGEDLRLAAHLIGLQAIHRRRQGDLRASMQLLDQRLVLARQIKDQALLADTIGDMLGTALDAGDLDALCRGLAEHNVELLSDPQKRAAHEMLRARCFLSLGERDLAREAFERGRRLTDEHGSAEGFDYYAEIAMIEIEHELGDTDHAKRLAAVALSKYAQSRTGAVVFQVLRTLAKIGVKQDDNRLIALVVLALNSLPAQAVRRAKVLAAELEAGLEPADRASLPQAGSSWPQVCELVADSIM